MLYFSSAGSLPNRPLLLLHGFMGRGKDYDPIIEGLKDNYFCIAPDLPGHGESILPLTGTDLPQEVCGHIIKTLNDLKVNQCDVVGYSMGGRIALYLKARYPERFGKLILFSTHAGLDSEQDRIKRKAKEEKWLSLLSSLPFKHFLEKWYEAEIFKGMANSDKIIKMRSQSPQYALKTYIERLALSTQPTFWGLPATYVGGGYDTRFCQLYTDRCANYSLVQKASHYLIGDAPNRCKSLIVKELEKNVTSHSRVVQNV